jgi:hypothetical protein
MAPAIPISATRRVKATFFISVFPLIGKLFWSMTRMMQEASAGEYEVNPSFDIAGVSRTMRGDQSAIAS